VVHRDLRVRSVLKFRQDRIHIPADRLDPSEQGPSMKTDAVNAS